MSAIPEDIQKTALDLARRGYWDGLSSRDIAHAILAERKRCTDQVLAYREFIADSEELEILERVIREGGIEP